MQDLYVAWLSNFYFAYKRPLFQIFITKRSLKIINFSCLLYKSKYQRVPVGICQSSKDGSNLVLSHTNQLFSSSYGTCWKGISNCKHLFTSNMKHQRLYITKWTVKLFLLNNILVLILTTIEYLTFLNIKLIFWFFFLQYLDFYS